MLETNAEDAPDILLEDAGFEDLRFCLTQVRRQIWDEEQFKSKLCYQRRETLGRSSLASFLRESFKRMQTLQKLERRLETIMDERKLLGPAQ